MFAPDSVQHVNVKVFVDAGSKVNLAEFIGVFHRWIQDGVRPELLIDVADYEHVPSGPGILLIGHQANYSMDNRENRLGLLYNRKDAIDGTFASRLAQALESALAACDLLEKEPLFAGKLKFDRNNLEVSVNDRLLAPNDETTWSGLRPHIEKAFPGAKIERVGEPRDLFRVSVRKTS